MRFEPLLDDPLVSYFVGLVGLILLWPIMVCVGMLVGLTSDHPRAILRRLPIDDHPLHAVYVFNLRCRVGEFLARHDLHLLPACLSLVLFEVTALDVSRMVDWRDRWRR